MSEFHPDMTKAERLDILRARRALVRGRPPSVEVRTVSRFRGGWAVNLYVDNIRHTRRMLKAKTYEEALAEAEAIEELPVTFRSAEYLYFIQLQNSDGFIKIGVANDVEKRVADIQGAVPYDVTILKVVQGAFGPGRSFGLERIFHSKFAHLRVRGEWFRPEPELLEAINTLEPLLNP